MKKALIDPTVTATYTSSWTAPVAPSTTYTPVFTEIQNSARVAEVASSEFPIAPPFFWVDCDDGVTADEWYYDTATQQITVIPPNAPYPGTEGATTGVQSV